MIDDDACCGDDYGNPVPPLLDLMINDAGCGDDDHDDCYDGNPAPPLAFGGPDISILMLVGRRMVAMM